MDPVIDWVSFKNENIEETQNIGNITRSWQFREQGTNPHNYPPNKTVLENIAEDILVKKPLKIRCCDLPGLPRSTFLMVFSPDGTKVASTHGNHNIYVSELASGKHVRILKGHPRTPWCIAFHPSHTQLIGSGCLGGQVRVWDITNGGSETWTVRNETVISSLAFHPREHLLLIATCNELYFWNWSQPAPFTKVSTNNVNEKVRYVAFDSLGYKLITGISLWNSRVGATNNSVLQQNSPMPATAPQPTRRDEGEENSEGNRSQDSSESTQDMIVDSYHNLVQRYDNLVRNYQRLFMVRHQLNNTPPPPNMIDRGTDPMETDTSSNSQSQSENTASTEPRGDNPTPGPSRRQDANDSGDGDNSSSRLLNLDALSFNNGPSTNQQPTNPDRPRWGRMLWRRSSAFQPLSDSSSSSLSFRTLDQIEGPRLLPNPFSTSASPQSNRTPFTNPHSARVPFSSNPSPLLSSTSRTSIFTPSRQESIEREFFNRRRSMSPSQPTRRWQSNTNDSSLSSQPSTSQDAQPSTSRTNTAARPTTTTRSSQISPSNQVDAQTINESLDLIRDILRDSGTRLLNLITNMSLSTLASVERNVSRRGANSRAQSEENESTNRARNTRPRFLRRVLLSSSSDSDSDQSLEVNIFRTRNSTFRENETEETPGNGNQNSERTQQPTDRMEFELNGDQTTTNQNDSNSFLDNIDVLMADRRFRVRTQNETQSNNNNEPEPGQGPSQEPSANTTTNEGGENQSSEPQPSTSRDNFWSGGSTIPPEEAYRKVRGGVSALHKHTMQLTNLWLRGNRVTMRELRTMWENLRRRILLLHRETGRQDLPSYYTRSLFERCMMLTELSDTVSRATPRNPRSHQRNENRNGSTDSTPTTSNASTSNQTESNQSPSTQNSSTPEARPTTTGRGSQTRASTLLTGPLRRRFEVNYRLRFGDELRRIRNRNAASNRLLTRCLNRPRRDFARAIELSATRHEIRMRAMQVLSVMFNMMMMCLEERGLSQLIINMLRTLKKALALTCLMLMTNRNNARGSGNIPGPPMNTRSSDPLNVVRIENTDHSEPVNVDGPDAETTENNTPTPDLTTAPAPTLSQGPTSVQNDKVNQSTKESKSTDAAIPSTSRSTIVERQEEAASIVSQRWSNRLAVQIAAANRNVSSTARNRRELYIESRRLKALHRTNPNVYPQIKKRALPPISLHRIPALRSLPKKSKITKAVPRAEASSSNSNPEPVAGPSREPPSGENSNEESPRSEVMYEFEQRVNLIRIAHMQAIRLRNVNRSRFRRLQEIRLYTPSSVREMYAIPLSTGENRAGNGSPFQNELIFREPDTNRRPVVTYRQQIHAHRIEPGSRPAEEGGQLHAVLNNVAMPLMQVNDVPVNQEGQGAQPQRLPRIHEYLQPIILAQNAMVVDEEGGGGEGGGGGGLGGGGERVLRRGGLGGLLDAGIISEAMPSYSHRIQAWDFSVAATPDIGDSTKNIVVPECRIHNDASIDISKDGRLLVALLPVTRIRSANHLLGVYSLEWSRLGTCLHKCVLEHNAVSVALSPTARHLAVGLGSRRFAAAATQSPNNVFALLYRLQPRDRSNRTYLSPIKELEQNWEPGFTSLNCLRWAPQPGQGLVYANNTGQLIIMS